MPNHPSLYRISTNSPSWISICQFGSLLANPFIILGIEMEIINIWMCELFQITLNNRISYSNYHEQTSLVHGQTNRLGQGFRLSLVARQSNLMIWFRLLKLIGSLLKQSIECISSEIPHSTLIGYLVVIWNKRICWASNLD